MNNSIDILNDTIEKTIDKCHWIKKQTPLDITNSVNEELNEVIEEIKNDNNNNLEEEVGDLLFTVILLGKLLENEGKISLVKSIERVNEKIIKRSPHVFGDKVANSPEEALAIWNAIKYREYKKRV
jgi:uncharacterized protein YabN with tetrapyrrole methylase and pyrophosphatase domain